MRTLIRSDNSVIVRQGNEMRNGYVMVSQTSLGIEKRKKGCLETRSLSAVDDMKVQKIGKQQNNDGSHSGQYASGKSESLKPHSVFLCGETVSRETKD